MRVFELTTRINAVQRSQGHTATSKAAYRACCVIECERESRTHDYSRKKGLEASEIVLPKDAPAWARDRAKLWNAAERREQNKDKRAKSKDKANAQTARDVLFTFPSELSAAGRLKTARIIAGYVVSTSAAAVDFNIHEPGKDGDERNHHCHMMFTTRRMTAKGLGEKTREWDDLKTGPKLSKALRKFIADTLNAELAAEGKADIARVEYRSFEARGMPRYSDIRCEPFPVQKPHPPIWVGGHSRAALRRTARDGDGWHPVGAVAASPLPPQEMRTHLDTLKRLTKAEGRDFSALTISYKAALYDVGIPSPDGLRRPFSGRPAEIADDIRTFASIGVHELIFDFRGQSIAESVERMQQFAAEVMPLAG